MSFVRECLEFLMSKERLHPWQQKLLTKRVTDWSFFNKQITNDPVCLLELYQRIPSLRLAAIRRVKNLAFFGLLAKVSTII